MKKRQIETGLLCGLFALLLSGCDMSGRSDGQLYQEPHVETETSVAKESTVTPTEYPTSDEEESAHTEVDAIVQKLGVGWNLGNALDAWDNSLEFGTIKEDTEDASGNPATTKAMIDMVKAEGFQTVRVPVTYYNHMQADGTIDPKWLARVKEVVDYVVQDDMNCVINIHHDTGDGGWLFADTKNYEKNKEIVSSMWTQIANYFSTYDNRLIFEGFNEMLNGEKAWDYAGDESYQVANQWNQLFVDTVRAAGGNNVERYLMMPGYDASLAGAITDLYQLPNDIVSDKLIVSVHAYTPYNFALRPGSESGATDYFSWEDPQSVYEINDLMNSLYNKFVSKGIPVVIGEYGAMNRDNNTQDRVDYYAYYTAAARANGITCCVWDNGSFTDGETFGILRRRVNKWFFEETIEAMMKYS